MNNIIQRSERRRSHNRIAAIMIHTSRYSFKGQARLAKDTGVSKATICRLVNGKTRPSYGLAYKVTRALEKDLKRALDLREVFSADGKYPTGYVCTLVGCSGCLPDRSHDERDEQRDEWADLQGAWSGDNQELQKEECPIRGEVK